MFDFSRLDIVTPALRHAVREYMEYGHQAGWPLRTAQTRERHLLTFLIFLAFNDMGTLSAVTPTMVQGFRDFLGGAGLHPALIQSYCHSVALFLRWCGTHPFGRRRKCVCGIDGRPIQPHPHGRVR